MQISPSPHCEKRRGEGAFIRCVVFYPLTITLSHKGREDLMSERASPPCGLSERSCLLYLHLNLHKLVLGFLDLLERR